MHTQLSTEKTPTAHKVYLLIIQLTTKWEEYADDPKFAPVKDALEASLANANKWYRTVKDTMMYFIMHGTFGWFLLIFYLKYHTVLDPTQKLTFLQAAWTEREVRRAKKKFEEIVSIMFMASLFWS